MASGTYAITAIVRKEHFGEDPNLCNGDICFYTGAMKNGDPYVTNSTQKALEHKGRYVVAGVFINQEHVVVTTEHVITLLVQGECMVRTHGAPELFQAGDNLYIDMKTLPDKARPMLEKSMDTVLPDPWANAAKGKATRDLLDVEANREDLAKNKELLAAWLIRAFPEHDTHRLKRFALDFLGRVIISQQPRSRDYVSVFVDLMK